MNPSRELSDIRNRSRNIVVWHHSIQSPRNLGTAVSFQSRLSQDRVTPAATHVLDNADGLSQQRCWAFQGTYNQSYCRIQSLSVITAITGLPNEQGVYFVDHRFVSTLVAFSRLNMASFYVFFR
jgi:hypothetical protein